MYEHYRTAITVDECNRLLLIAQLPPSPAAAGGAPGAAS